MYIRALVNALTSNHFAEKFSEFLFLGLKFIPVFGHRFFKSIWPSYHQRLHKVRLIVSYVFMACAKSQPAKKIVIWIVVHPKSWTAG